MHRIVAILVLLMIARPSLSQENAMSYAEQLQAIEDEMDSLSIFNLIDGILSAEPTNELSLRMGFTTNVTSAGRDYDLSQSGMSAGAAYYHKSGFFGDVSGYWNSGVDPNYNPTVLSAGYLGSFKNTDWSYSVDAESWFFNPKDSSENPLKYSLGASLNYDFKWGFTSLDYSFLFGRETANRIILNVTGSIDLGKFWKFKTVGFYPSAGMIIGNGDITQLRITNQEINAQTANRLNRITTFAGLTTDQKRYLGLLILRAFENGTIDTETRNELLIDLRNSEELSSEDIAALQTIANEGYEITEFVDSKRFGTLSYAFTLPLSLSTDQLYFLFAYTYSIPVQLPEEFIDVDPIGYFSASITYRIPFK